MKNKMKKIIAGVVLVATLFIGGGLITPDHIDPPGSGSVPQTTQNI